MEGAFAAEVAVEVADRQLVIEVKMHLENTTIRECIESGHAMYAVVITCRQTYLRSQLLTAEPEISIRRSADNYRGIVEIEPSVIAVGEIPNYRPAGLSAEYGDASFAVYPADALALAPLEQINLEPDFDPLRAPIASIMRITSRAEVSGPMRVSYDGDQIVIELARSTWDDYQQAKLAGSADLLHASIVLPVLVEAVQKALNSNEEIQHQRWCTRLVDMLAARSLAGEDSPLYVAQALLDDPASRAMKTIIAMAAAEDDE